MIFFAGASTLTARGSTLDVRIWHLQTSESDVGLTSDVRIWRLQTSDHDVCSQSLHCKSKNIHNDRRHITWVIKWSGKSQLGFFFKLKKIKNPRKNRMWVRESNPNSDFIFWNCVFCVLFFVFGHVSKKINRMWGWVGWVWPIRVFLGFFDFF